MSPPYASIGTGSVKVKVFSFCMNYKALCNKNGDKIFLLIFPQVNAKWWRPRMYAATRVTAAIDPTWTVEFANSPDIIFCFLCPFFFFFPHRKFIKKIITLNAAENVIQSINSLLPSINKNHCIEKGNDISLIIALRTNHIACERRPRLCPPRRSYMYANLTAECFLHAPE